jgi:transposase
MAAAANLPATALQVQAWKRRMGYSISEAATELDVHPRTFARWLADETTSPKWLGEKFRTEGVKK